LPFYRHSLRYSSKLFRCVGLEVDRGY